MGKQTELKDFRFELKEVTDEGSFTGILSVYGVTDLVGDCVDAGAFTKTLQESGGTIPCLFRHEEPIGELKVVDTGTALEVKGQLCLDRHPDGTPMVPEAFKALALMRRRIVKGLSIGFRTIKAAVVDAVRHLKEVSLQEGSVVLFPALPLAQITSVKELGMEKKMDFSQALANVQTFAAYWQYYDALQSAMGSVLWDETVTTDDAVAQIAASVQQFGAQVTDLVPKLRALYNSTYGYDFKRLAEIEKKEGRKLSKESRSKIEAAMRQLQALMDDEEMMEEGTGKQATPPETKQVPPSGAASQQPEPAPHSDDSINELKEIFHGFHRN